MRRPKLPQAFFSFRDIHFIGADNARTVKKLRVVTFDFIKQYGEVCGCIFPNRLCHIKHKNEKTCSLNMAQKLVAQPLVFVRTLN